MINPTAWELAVACEEAYNGGLSLAEALCYAKEILSSN